MRHTFLLVAALGLTVVTGPSALAQEPEQPPSDSTPAQPSAEPATPPETQPEPQPETAGETPQTLPQTYTQPATPGQAAPTTTQTIPVPCGYVMPSAHIPGTVNYGSQMPYQPQMSYGTMQYMTPPTHYSVVQDGQPAMQTTTPPAMSAVTGGVVTQPTQAGTIATSGMTYPTTQPGMVSPYGTTYQPTQPGMVYQGGTTYQPVVQTGMVYSNGLTYQPMQNGMVYQGGMTYGGQQPIMLTGYAGEYVAPYTTTQPTRRGFFRRR